MSLSSLKKTMANVEALKEQFASNNNSYSSTSEWFRAGASDAGNGYVKMRFLPPSEGDSEYMVSWVEFNWKGDTGKSYWGKSLKTLGRESSDPCQTYLDGLWNEGSDDSKKLYSSRKRRKKFAANVYIIEDKQNPENNGKVFPMKFGPAIYSHIKEAITPEEDEFETKESFIPFDPFGDAGGRNFIMRFKEKSGFRNYDDSHFEKEPSRLGTDDEIEAIWKQTKEISRFVAPDQFESYDKLHTRLVGALGYDPLADIVEVSKPAPTVKESTPEPEAKSVSESKPMVKTPESISSDSIDMDDLDGIDISFD